MATPTQEHDDDHKHDQKSGDQERLHPARGAWARPTVGDKASDIVGAGIEGWVRHCQSSFVRAASGVRVRREFTRQNVAVKPRRTRPVEAYTSIVPKLWTQTIEAHRREVHDAILETTAALVADHGLLAVTMSQIAEETGIGRATLYKYFPDVEGILFAWHERKISGHLEHLAGVRDQAADAGERLEAVLEAYALISFESRGQHDTDLGAFLHGDQQVAVAEQELHHMIRNLLTECAEDGVLRKDVSPEELAGYCLHALAAARRLPSRAAVRRLVAVTLAGLRLSS